MLYNIMEGNKYISITWVFKQHWDFNARNGEWNEVGFPRLRDYAMLVDQVRQHNREGGEDAENIKFRWTCLVEVNNKDGRHL